MLEIFAGRKSQFPLEFFTQGSPKQMTYHKGKQKTRDLLPTKKTCLGKGSSGHVFPHRDYASLVVKRIQNDNSSRDSLVSVVNEFEMGSSLQHPNLAKSYALFVKYYPEGKTVSKIVMERIDGDAIGTVFDGKHRYSALPMQGLMPEDLLRQIHECALYLFDQGISWGDFTHPNNMMITHKSRTLKFFDFSPGHWETQLALPHDRALRLMWGSNDALRHVLRASHSDNKSVLCSYFSEQEIHDVGDGLCHKEKGGEPYKAMAKLFLHRREKGTPAEAKHCLQEVFKAQKIALLELLISKQETAREQALEAALQPIFTRYTP